MEGDSPHGTQLALRTSGLPHPTSKPPITVGSPFSIHLRGFCSPVEGPSDALPPPHSCLPGGFIGSAGLMRDVLHSTETNSFSCPQPLPQHPCWVSLPASLLGGAGTEPGPGLCVPLCLRSPLAHDSAAPGVSSQDTCCPQLRLHLALCHREDGAGRVYAGRLGSGMMSAAFLQAGLQEIWALLVRARKLARLDMDQGLRVQVNSSCLPPAI